MNKVKYVGMDVHMAMTAIAVLDHAGKVIGESVIQTTAETIRDFFRGLSGRVLVTFEEGTQASWLYELIRPLVAELIVCDPRRNKLITTGNKADKIDARKLADLLRLGSLNPVYHGDAGTKKLKEVVRIYDTLITDSIRVMNRIKAIYRGRGIATCGKPIYATAARQEWIDQISDQAFIPRLLLLYSQLDALLELRKQARRLVVQEVRRQPAYRILHQIPSLGPIRIAIIIAVVVSPHRFRTKRQFWPYCGLAVVTVSSADFVVVDGKMRKSNKPAGTRGLNHNYNRQLKSVFKDAAQYASRKTVFKEYYGRLLAKNIRKEMAMLTLARKISATTLAIWKSGRDFDPSTLALEKEGAA